MESDNWINTYITTGSKMQDDIYVQLFVVKDGVRYDMKVFSLGEVTNIITKGLLDGIEKLCI